MCLILKVYKDESIYKNLSEELKIFNKHTPKVQNDKLMSEFI